MLDKKWELFHKRARVFNHVPFVDFAIASGSMAMGTAKETSDFDVIVGVRSGRIFTARFLSIIVTNALRIRATAHDNFENKSNSADKICLNHFVTKESYKLSPPYNEYWKKLYESLVPLIGDAEKIKLFFEKNDWVDVQKTKFKHLNIETFKYSLIRKFLEMILEGRVGDVVEKYLKRYQINRIQRGLNSPNHYKPRIIYSDSELEFHPNTRRIENYLGNL